MHPASYSGISQTGVGGGVGLVSVGEGDVVLTGAGVGDSEIGVGDESGSHDANCYVQGDGKEKVSITLRSP